MGTYELESVDGKSLPALVDFETLREAIFDEELGCEEYVTAGTLTIMSNNRYERRETGFDGRCDDPADDAPSVEFTNNGTWTLNGGSVSLIEDQTIATHTATGTWSNEIVDLTFRLEIISVETKRRVYRRR